MSVATIAGLNAGISPLSKIHTTHRSGLSVDRALQAPSPTAELDRHGLLVMHLPQVRLVARSIWNRLHFAVELDDLVGYGTIGLLNAVDRYDPQRGILLKTYAEHRIRGAILDGLRSMDWLPRSARQKERERQQQTELNQYRDPAALSAELSPKVSGKGGPRTSIAHPPRMEAVFSGGGLCDLEKLLEARQTNSSIRSGAADPESAYACKERFTRLADAICRLPRRHRILIELYYRRELSMKEIGEILRVHESRISQLHAAALQRLRKSLENAPTQNEQDRDERAGAYPSASALRSPRRRMASCKSDSVSTPMVSCSVSTT